MRLTHWIWRVLVAALLAAGPLSCGGEATETARDMGMEGGGGEDVAAETSEGKAGEGKTEVPVVPGAVKVRPGGLDDSAAGIVQAGKYRVRSVTGWSALPVIRFDSFTLRGGTVGAVAGGRESGGQQ